MKEMMKNIKTLEIRHNSLAESICDSHEGSRVGCLSEIDAALSDYFNGENIESVSDSGLYNGEGCEDECESVIVFDAGNSNANQGVKSTCGSIISDSSNSSNVLDGGTSRSRFKRGPSLDFGNADDSDELDCTGATGATGVTGPTGPHC
jgi:hypothetical protein